jgi:hypothetical protein
MTPLPATASSPSCGRAKPLTARRFAPICVGWYSASSGIGRTLDTRITSAADAFRHTGSLRDPIRGDSHYGRREAMDWCEQNGIRYIFGLSPNAVLATHVFTNQVFAKTDAVCVPRATGNLDVVRDYAVTRYAARSWLRPRRVVARIEATRKGLDVRYVVTNITYGTPAWLYDDLYCARRQAENLIKRHKS